MTNYTGGVLDGMLFSEWIFRFTEEACDIPVSKIIMRDYFGYSERSIRYLKNQDINYNSTKAKNLFNKLGRVLPEDFQESLQLFLEGKRSGTINGEFVTSIVEGARRESPDADLEFHYIFHLFDSSNQYKDHQLIPQTLEEYITWLPSIFPFKHLDVHKLSSWLSGVSPNYKPELTDFLYLSYESGLAVLSALELDLIRIKERQPEDYPLKTRIINALEGEATSITWFSNFRDQYKKGTYKTLYETLGEYFTTESEDSDGATNIDKNFKLWRKKGGAKWAQMTRLAMGVEAGYGTPSEYILLDYALCLCVDFFVANIRGARLELTSDYVNNSIDKWSGILKNAYPVPSNSG